MKSLPEYEFWKVVSNRLEQYSEEPSADEWDKIRGALPPRPSNTSVVNRAADVIVLTILAFLLGFQVAKFSENGVEESALSDVPKQESKTSAALPKEKSLSEDQDTNTSKISDDNEKGNATRNESDGASDISEKENSTQTKTLFHSTGESQRKAGAKPNPLDLRNIGDSQHARSSTNTVLPFASLSENPEGSSSIITADTKSEFNTANDQTKYFSQDSLRASVPEMRTANAAKQSKGDILPDRVVKADSVASLRTSKESPVKTNAVPDQKEKKRKKFRPTVFAQLNPSMAYQKIIPSTDDNVTIQKLNSSGIISADRFGMSGEVGVQIPVARSLEVYASLGYYRKRTKISYDFLSDENPTVNASHDPFSFEITPSSATKTYTFTSQHKGISMGALYLVRGNKLQQKFGAGIFYMRGSRKVINGDIYNSALSRYAGYQLQYRLEYTLSPRAGLYIQPFFRHSLSSSETQNEPFRIKPYWAGVSIGYIYRF